MCAKRVWRSGIETRHVLAIQSTPALHKRYAEVVADDVNVSGILTVTWQVVREANRASDVAEERALLDLVLDFGRVLGLQLSHVVDADVGTLQTTFFNSQPVRKTREAHGALDSTG